MTVDAINLLKDILSSSNHFIIHLETPAEHTLHEIFFID